MTTASVAFGGTASLTDSEAAGANSSADVNLGQSSVDQFNKLLGVLTGATINLTSTRTQTVSTTSTDGPNNGNNNSVTTSGSGSSTARLQAPGVDNAFASVTASDNCTGARQGACSDGATTAIGVATDLGATVPGGSLDDYVGAGSVTITRSAPSVTAEQLQNKFTGNEATTYTVDWSGNLSIAYDYLLHAAPSFTSPGASADLTLDFGHVALNGIGMLPFDLFNLAGDRVGLDLDSIAGSGDTSKFLSNLVLFSDLAAGGANSYWASLVTSSAGEFSASYLLTFSDADVGAASSRSNDMALTLRLHGVVDAQIDPPPTAVPEPATLALCGIGLVGMGFSRRRKRS
jgi:hypothetical protein